MTPSRRWTAALAAGAVLGAATGAAAAPSPTPAPLVLQDALEDDELEPLQRGGTGDLRALTLSNVRTTAGPAWRLTWTMNGEAADASFVLRATARSNDRNVPSCFMYVQYDARKVEREPDAGARIEACDQFSSPRVPFVRRGDTASLTVLLADLPRSLKSGAVLTGIETEVGENIASVGAVTLPFDTADTSKPFRLGR